MALTSLDISKIIAKKNGFNHETTKTVINEAFNAIKEGMMIGERVMVVGFGTFTPTIRKGRRFCVPTLAKTNPGEPRVGEDYYYPKFSPSPHLKKLIRNIDKQNRD